MSDDPVRLSMIGQILRGRWRLLTAIAAVGALLGVGASLLFSPGYQASTSVLLQGPREPDELLTEAQVAMSSVVLDRTAAALGWNVSGAELRDSVSASVADGNVIEVTGTAETPERAQRLSDRVAEEYVTFATQLVSNTADASAQVRQEQRDALRQQIAQTNDRITELHGSATQGATIESVEVRTELEALRAALNDAVGALDKAEVASSRANMVVMGPAERPTGRAAPTMVHFIVGGTLVFFLFGVFGHLVAARRDRRLRGEPEIASALGSTVLGSVDIPDEPGEEPTPERPGRVRSWLRWLLQDGQPWDVPQLTVSDDDLDRDIRYRRALSRLRDGSDDPKKVLVLVADDDPAAHRAVTRLTAVADAEPLTHRTTLRVVKVAAGRPTVPDGGGVSGALVVVTTGTRTAWQLVGIAEACADAGHEVLGTVVIHRARPATDRPIEPAKATSPNGVVDHDAMAGSS